MIKILIGYFGEFQNDSQTMVPENYQVSGLRFYRKTLSISLTRKKRKHEDKDTSHSAAGNLDSVIKIRSELHHLAMILPIPRR